MTSMPALNKVALGASIAVGLALVLWLLDGRLNRPPAPPADAGPPASAVAEPEAEATYVGSSRVRGLPRG